MWKDSGEQAEKKQMRILNPEVCRENWKRKQNSFHLDTKYLLNWSNSERIREILKNDGNAHWRSIFEFSGFSEIFGMTIVFILRKSYFKER